MERSRPTTDAPADLLWDNTPMHETMLRDHLEQLLSRLDRVGAATTMLRELSRRLDEGHAPLALVDVLETLDRDLLLAAHDLDDTQRQAMRETESLSGASERTETEG